VKLVGKKFSLWLAAGMALASIAAIGASGAVGNSTELLPPHLAGPARWSAHWIVGADSIRGENLMFLARTTFELPAGAPDRAVLFITADTRYELFVNGTFLARGPARSAAHHQSFDALDVARLLRTGRNVLAVRFHHPGTTRSHHLEPRPGLLAQLEVTRAGAITRIGTDATWKIVSDPSWDRGSPHLNAWVDAFADISDLRARPDGWTTIGFDDAAWPAAASIVPGGVLANGKIVPLPVPQWWPMPEADDPPRAITPPWISLVARDVPALAETTVFATRIAASGLLLDNTKWPPASARFTALPLLKLPALSSASTEAVFPLVTSTPAGKAAFHLFDLGTVHSAYPHLELEGPAGTIIDVLTTPYVLNDVFNPSILNSFSADRIILSGRHESWDAFFFKPTRYLAVVVRGASAPVTLHVAGITATAYPWTRRGGFSAPGNPWLSRFWQAGAKTIEVITTDAYTDNYRERRQYPQTSYYAARGNYAAFGDTFLQRRYLVQNAEEQEPDGTLGGYAPIANGRYMPFLDVQFFWLMGWRDYLLYSGDEATTRRLLPAARRVLDRLAALAGPGGLIADPPYPYWIDHSHLDRRGANFTLNALYALTLDNCAQTLDWLGEPGAATLRQTADDLRARLHAEFWRAERGLFAEALVAGKLSTRFSEHANAIAVAARIASPEQTRAILPKLLKPDADLVPATSLFVYWTMAAFCQEGRVDDALALLEKRFAHQLAPDTNGTLWEEWYLDRTYRRGFREKNSRADAQGECGIFPEALTRWVAGLEPVSPGQREFSLRRPATALRDIATVWPTPHGDLRVTWSANALTINVPAKTTVRLDLASLNAAPGSLRLDDAPSPEGNLPALTLTAGAHQLSFQSR